MNIILFGGAKDGYTYDNVPDHADKIVMAEWDGPMNQIPQDGEATEREIEALTKNNIVHITYWRTNNISTDGRTVFSLNY